MEQFTQTAITVTIGIIMLLIGRFFGQKDKQTEVIKSKEDEMLKKLEASLIERVTNFEKSFTDSNKTNQRSLEELGSKYNKLAESVTEISSKQKEMQAKIEGNDKLIDQRFSEQATMLHEIKDLLSNITTIQVKAPEQAIKTATRSRKQPIPKS